MPNKIASLCQSVSEKGCRKILLTYVARISNFCQCRHSKVMMCLPILLAFLAAFFFGFPAEAQESHSEILSRPAWTDWLEPCQSIEPWLGQLNEKIRQQPGYNELLSNWPGPLHARYGQLSESTPSLDFEEVAYSFRVTSEGSFENITLRLGSGKAAVDARIRELIFSASPFKPPLNVTQDKKIGVMVVIKNDGRHLSIRSHIPR